MRYEERREYRCLQKTIFYTLVLVDFSQLEWGIVVSDFGINHSIGIVIDNLEELNHVLNSLPYEEYLRLVKNVEPIQKNLISGFYFRKAFDEALTKLANHHN